VKDGIRKDALRRKDGIRTGVSGSTAPVCASGPGPRGCRPREASRTSARPTRSESGLERPPVRTRTNTRRRQSPKQRRRSRMSTAPRRLDVGLVDLRQEVRTLGKFRRLSGTIVVWCIREQELFLGGVPRRVPRRLRSRGRDRRTQCVDRFVADDVRGTGYGLDTGNRGAGDLCNLPHRGRRHGLHQ